MQSQVVFVIPYFGKLPSYFNSFIQTIEGKKLDVLFFSDIEKPSNLPLNIKWQHYTFKALKDLFEIKLQQPITLKDPYKLCDFKPAYGLLFDTYIKDYTFWGVMDLDICIGNFDKYINAEVLNSLDVYSGIKEYISGSFFIVRNNNYFNKIFQKSKDWKKVFSNEKYLGFDECGGRHFEQLKQGKTFTEIKPAIESFTETLVKENKEITRIKFTDHIVEPKRGITTVDIASVMYNKTDHLLIHFIYYKSWYFFYTNKKVKLPFYISRLGFFQNQPNFFEVLTSKNIRFAIQEKIKINLKKLQLRA